MDSDSDSEVDRGSDGDSIEENSVASEFDDSFFEEMEILSGVPSASNLERIKNNDSRLKYLGAANFVDMNGEEWEELGRDISNNTHLKRVSFNQNSINDHKASFFFTGLRGSSSIEGLMINARLREGTVIEEHGDGELTVAGVRSMVPFLQNTCNLRKLVLSGNNIQSEGFNTMFRALSDSPIEEIHCHDCGIESIDIDESSIPRKLASLYLQFNSIKGDGCRELAKLLRGGSSSMEVLNLDCNQIDDDGVAFLVEALRGNTSLKILQSYFNHDISQKGLLMMLKLVNDISSAKSTFQSNHTLEKASLHRATFLDEKSESELLGYTSPQHSLHCKAINYMIDKAIAINKRHGGNAEAAGREKLIQQLCVDNRAVLGRFQGVGHSLYSEIDPLYLPEMLSLVGRKHGRELYATFKSLVGEVISLVNARE